MVGLVTEVFKKQISSCKKMTKIKYSQYLKYKKNLLIQATILSYSDPCEKAVRKCKSECDDSIYDYGSGNYLYDTNYKEECEDACESGKRNCSYASTSDKCDDFKSRCNNNCPSSIYSSKGDYLYSTDAEDKCEDACKAGYRDCED